MTLSVVLPGLPVPGSSFDERLDVLRSATTSERVAWLRAWIAATAERAPAVADAVAEQLGAPRDEVIASPFGLRACLLGARAGAALAHHEMRVPMPWAESSAPPDSVVDGLHGVWDRGVFHIGKYQSFHQEDVFAGFNPGHMAKWTPHELLHRAIGAFWREDASAWEFCVGARINELLPVVLWYGIDQIGRDGSGAFDRAAMAARPSVGEGADRWCEAALPDEELERCAELLVQSIVHFVDEVRAVHEEIEGTRPVPVTHAFAPHLDAASDAAAYVVGHRARLNERALRRLMTHGLVEGEDHATSVGALLDRVVAAFDALLFGDLVWDAAHAASARSRAELVDVLLRVAAPGWVSFRPVASRLARVRDALNAAHSDGGAACREVLASLRTELPGACFAQGLRHLPPTHDGLAQLRAGVESFAPCTAQLLDDEALIAFVTRDGFWQRASLPARLDAWLATREASVGLRDLVRLEQAFAQLEHDDPWIRSLAASPEEVVDLSATRGSLRVHEGLRAIEVATDVLTLHAEPSPENLQTHARPPTWIVVALREEEAVVVDVPAGLAAWLEVHRGSFVPVGEAREQVARFATPPDDDEEAPGPDDWLLTLLDTGLVGWIPAVADED